MQSKDIKKIVQRNLWSRNYGVKTAAEFYSNPTYDFLVEGRFKVLVVRDTKEGRCIGEGVADTVALVSFDAAGRPVIRYTTGGEPTLNPREVFGLPSSKSKEHENKEKGRKKSGIKKGGEKVTAEKE